MTFRCLARYDYASKLYHTRYDMAVLPKRNSQKVIPRHNRDIGCIYIDKVLLVKGMSGRRIITRRAPVSWPQTVAANFVCRRERRAARAARAGLASHGGRGYSNACVTRAPPAVCLSTSRRLISRAATARGNYRLTLPHNSKKQTRRRTRV